ncbi:hypothetical protein BDA99DRAFT_494541 [Phascolomyces articulosus]|uniref:Uncharacterized protein n=1 Tax=Phascolomyces articulosus TaxID=60185 RepID=A0AAD5PJP0_9FUNG|nr:hypothetical protein BDA99DRAFT_494541 [Phascolomyces articulosus]
MPLPQCTDADLELLSKVIAQFPANSIDNSDPIEDNNSKSLALAVKKLKRFMTTDAIKLIQWTYVILQARTTNNVTIDANSVTLILKDTVNIALIDLLVECIAFREAIDDSVFGALLNLGKESIGTPMSMLWLLCLICERLPQWSIPRIHEYLLWSFATVGNPHIDGSV